MAYSGRYRLRVDGCFITIVDSAWYSRWTDRADQLLHARWRYVVDPIAATATPKFPMTASEGVAIWRKE